MDHLQAIAAKTQIQVIKSKGVDNYLIKIMALQDMPLLMKIQMRIK